MTSKISAGFRPTPRLAVAIVFVCASLFPAARARSQAETPPLPPPPPPLPGQQPFQILTPPVAKPPTGPAIVPISPLPTPIFNQPNPQITVPIQSGALTNLAWDAEQKEYNSKPGDLNANFTFW